MMQPALTHSVRIGSRAGLKKSVAISTQRRMVVIALACLGGNEVEVLHSLFIGEVDASSLQGGPIDRTVRKSQNPISRRLPAG